MSSQAIEEIVSVNIGMYDKLTKKKISEVEDLNNSALTDRIKYLEDFVETLKFEIDKYQGQIRHYLPHKYSDIKSAVTFLLHQRRVKQLDYKPFPKKNGPQIKRKRNDTKGD